MNHLTKFLLSILVSTTSISKAQKIDSIYVNLYTDSLKKGTLNYINIDGRLPDGRYLPLDTTSLIYSSSAGRFTGNCLFVDTDFREEKINVKVILKNNPSISKQFDIYIKKNPDNEKLKTVEEIINGVKDNKRSKRKKDNNK